MGLFSVLAPIGLLDSGSNLIWTCNVKWTLQWRPIDPPPASHLSLCEKEYLEASSFRGRRCPFVHAGRTSVAVALHPTFALVFPPLSTCFIFFFPSLSGSRESFQRVEDRGTVFWGTIAPQFLSSNFLAHWTKISQTISDSPGRNKISPKRARPCEIPLHIPSGSRLPHFAVLFSAFPDGAIVNAFLFPFLEEFRVGCFMDQPPLLFPSGFKNCCMQTSLRYSLSCVQFSSAIFFSLVSSFWCTPPFVEHTLRTVRVCIYVDEHSVARLCLTWQIGVFSAADCQNLRVAVHLLHDPSNRDHITKYCFILESHSIW